jgi:hypothetical protein
MMPLHTETSGGADGRMTWSAFTYITTISLIGVFTWSKSHSFSQNVDRKPLEWATIFFLSNELLLHHFRVPFFSRRVDRRCSSLILSVDERLHSDPDKST